MPAATIKNWHTQQKPTVFPAEADAFGDTFPGDWPAIAMSKDLGVRNLLSLAKQRSSGTSFSNDSFAATFSIESLPADWRGYSGLDAVILTDSEWQELSAKSPSVCRALLEWNRLGGRLDIYSKQELTPEALGIRDVVSERRSFGTLHVYGWNGREFDPEELVNRYGGITHLQASLNDASGITQELRSSLGKRSFGNWQVALILIAFGIVVGPVNLFIFAKPGKRHRLFVTTPLISLVASLLLIALILLQDGTGGKGQRLVLVSVEPNETNAYINQYQSLRTGVLFSGAFEAARSFISQTALEEGAWVAVDDEGGLPKRYTLNGDVFGGDWFQSRREHGHRLQTVRPTRGRVELASSAGEAPTVVSSFGFELSRIQYTDSDGNVWLSPSSVQTGTPVELEKKDENEEAMTLSASVSDTGINADALAQPGHFVATAISATDLTIDTLGSIDWSDEVILFGPIGAGK